MTHYYKLLFFMLCMMIATLAFAQYDQEAYWSDETGIYHFDPETSVSTRVVEGGNPSVTGGIHVDTDKVYYLSNNRRYINVVDYDGGNASLLVDIESIDWLQENGSDYKVIDVSYDFADSKGYFTAVQSPVNNYAKSTSVFRTPSVVYGFDLTTGALDSLFAGMPYDTIGSNIYYEQIPSLTINHAHNELVYLIEEDVHSRIETRDLDGSNVNLIVEGFEEANWIEIDEATQTMFIMAGRRRAGFDAIYKANLDGSNFQTIFQDNIQGDLGFLLTPSNLYFMDDDNEVLLSDLNGGNVSVSDDVFFTTSLLENTIDDVRDELYFILSGELKRISIGGGSFINLVSQFQFIRKLQVDDFNERLFYQFGDFGSIASMDFDGGNLRGFYSPPLNTLVLDWKLDVNDSRVITLEKDETVGVNEYNLYRRPFSDPDNGSLISGDIGQFDAFDIDPVADNLVLFPRNVIPDDAVYDFKNKKAYYLLSDNGSDAIYVLDDLTQEEGTELTFFNVNDPQNLVLNREEDKLYWSNTSGSEGQYRMDLDGSNEEKIADFPVQSLAFVVETVDSPKENTPPQFTLSQTALTLEAEFEMQTIEVVPATVPDNEQDQTVIYSLSPESVELANLSINTSTGQVSITAIEGQYGTQEVFVIANDGQIENSTHSESFMLTVLEDGEVILSVRDEQLDVQLYPNPANRFMTIQSNEQVIAVSVTDSTGKLVQSYNNIKQDQLISLEALKTGVYFLSIQTANHQVVKRLIRSNAN